MLSFRFQLFLRLIQPFFKTGDLLPAALKLIDQFLALGAAGD